jgi:hypothetical protein
MISREYLLGIIGIGLLVYFIAIDKPHGRNTVKYVSGKIGAGVASVAIGMLALSFTGTDNFWTLAIALLLGQIAFKVTEHRLDSLAHIYC